MPRRSSPIPRDESLEALEAVLRDQADRERRRSGAPSASRGGSRGLLLLSLALAAVTASVWWSPPAFVRPGPLPAPGPERIEAGLRLDLWIEVQRIRKFQRERRRLPVALLEVPVESGEGIGLSYELVSPEEFRLRGSRGGADVTYDSKAPLGDLLRPALSTLRRERPW